VVEISGCQFALLPMVCGTWYCEVVFRPFAFDNREDVYNIEVEECEY
jgi:hypothetical protein